MCICTYVGLHCICIYVHVCVCAQRCAYMCIHISAAVCVCGFISCMYECSFVCWSSGIDGFMHAIVHVRAHACIYACMHNPDNLCVFACSKQKTSSSTLNICMYTIAQCQAQKHTCMHTHIHAYRLTYASVHVFKYVYV